MRRAEPHVRSKQRVKQTKRAIFSQCRGGALEFSSSKNNNYQKNHVKSFSERLLHVKDAGNRR